MQGNEAVLVIPVLFWSKFYMLYHIVLRSFLISTSYVQHYRRTALSNRIVYLSPSP